jgi:putative flippase GtrA
MQTVPGESGVEGHAGGLRIGRIDDSVDSYRRTLDWRRLNRAARRKENWAQLLMFCLIGGSGYLVNLALFTLCVDSLDIDSHVSAVGAFLCAVCNNFVWNRRWTFPRIAGDAKPEMIRFLVVSTVAFLISFAILSTLITFTRLPAIAAQVISIAVSTPVSFVGNKVWTFRQGWAGTSRALVGGHSR